MFNHSFRKIDKNKSAHWYLRGPIIGLLFIVVLLYACAFLLSKEIMPSTLMNECVIVSVFLGSAAGGVAAAKIKREGVLTAGVLTGAMVLAVILLVIILRPSGNLVSDDTLKTAICAVGGGTFGGVLCLRRSGSRKHKRSSSR